MDEMEQKVKPDNSYKEALGSEQEQKWDRKQGFCMGVRHLLTQTLPSGSGQQLLCCPLSAALKGEEQKCQIV